MVSGDRKRCVGSSRLVRCCDAGESLRSLLRRYAFFGISHHIGKRPENVVGRRRVHGAEGQQYCVQDDRLCGHVVQFGWCDVASGGWPRARMNAHEGELTTDPRIPRE